MPNIPYPEFKDFHLKLDKNILQGSQNVEGFVFLSMNELPNCVKDILIACRCCFRYRTDDGTTHTVLLHEEIQRNATPFDEDGIPEGEYEFPFSFSFPPSLPPSVNVVGGWDSTCNCRLWYEVRAYVMHSESHGTMERKHLRTSVKFQRCAAIGATTELAPTAELKKDHNFKRMEVRVELDKDVYVHGEPVQVSLAIKHDLLRGIHAIRVAVRQTVAIRKRSMRQVREFVVKHLVDMEEAPGKAIKRNMMYTTKVNITPSYVPEDGPNMLGGLALAGILDQTAPSKLAPTINRHTSEGIDVSYHIVVSLSVIMSSDFVVAVPFTLSDVQPSSENTAPPTYWEELDAGTNGIKHVDSIDKQLDAAISLIGDGADQNIPDCQPPTYDETMNSKSLYRLPPHLAHNINARKMQMSRTQITGSTDDFNHKSHDLNASEREDYDSGNANQEPAEPMSDIDEDHTRSFNALSLHENDDVDLSLDPTEVIDLGAGEVLSEIISNPSHMIGMESLAREITSVMTEPLAGDPTPLQSPVDQPHTSVQEEGPKEQGEGGQDADKLPGFGSRLFDI